MLAVPGAEGICLAIAYAWDDLPERADATKVRITGADPEVTLGGYLFQPQPASDRAVILLHGYGGNASLTTALGRRLAETGWVALCLSQRGWLGSTGQEDQGLRQPDDVLCAAAWLKREIGAATISLMGFSQGGQVALLAAARAPDFAAIVAWFPCTNLKTWPLQVDGDAIHHYLEEFVRPEDVERCSPTEVAHQISAPVLLIHGDNDSAVPIEQSHEIVAANPAIQLRIVSGGDHGLGAQFDEIWPEAVAFLNDHVLQS